MKDLIDYVQKYAIRGECQCGKCFDVKEGPEINPAHSADLMFFKVHAAPGADANELGLLVRANVKGEFGDVSVFDGKEHSYLELGGWIGDQGLALQLMGLGNLLGLWDLLTPRTMLGDLGLSEESLMAMAGQGLLTIKAKT